MNQKSTRLVRGGRDLFYCLALACLGTACSALRADRGSLLIIGGGLREEHAEVYRAFTGAAGPEARLVVLPTASGVPEESGPGTARDLEPHLQPDQVLVVSALEHDAPGLAAEPAHVVPLDGAGGYWFTGGVQSRILAVFRPGGADSPAYRAVREGLRAGAVVAGTSAGAAMMSDPMIAWGGSREALLIGVSNGVEDRGVGLEQGMGFFPYGLVDQHFLRRGRLGRLIVALEESEHTLGFGVADNRALLVDLAADCGTAIGDAAVVVVDASGLRREGYSRLGLRLHLLGEGDAFDFARDEVLVAAGKTLAPSPAPDLEPETPVLDEPWGRDTAKHLVQSLALAPSREQRAEGELFSLRVTADERTRFYSHGSNPERLCAVNVRLDILAGLGAEERAAELLRELESEDPQP